MAATQGWLTPKNIGWGIVIFIGLAVFGAVFGPDESDGSDGMRRDAAKAAQLYRQFLELNAIEMTNMAVALQNKTKYSPDAARKKRMEELTEEVEAIQAKYSGSKEAKFKALMDEARK
jgi:hypothetical protein